MDKEIALPGAAAVNYESPLIMKLDKIFNNLFGKRGKLQSKTYT